MFFYGLYFWKDIRKSASNYKQFISVIIIVTILLCAYIYLPMVSIGSNPYGKMEYKKDMLGSLYFNSANTSFLNLFRLWGATIMNNYSYYNDYTNNALIIIIGYILSLLVFFSLLFNGGKKLKLFFATVIIISIYFAKGSHPPFEQLFLFIFSKVPFFPMFRATYHKFVIFTVLAYSVLIGMLVLQILSVKIKYYYKSLILLVPMLICIYNFPFFLNRVIYKDFLSVIPKEYKLVLSKINTNSKEYKILSLPAAPNGSGLLLKWGSENRYVGPHPDMFFFNKPVIDSYWFVKNNFLGMNFNDSWNGAVLENNIDQILKYCKYLNVMYLLLHKDFMDGYNFGSGQKFPNYLHCDGHLKAKTVIEKLKFVNNIRLIEDNKYYSIYELPEIYTLPKIYASLDNLLITGYVYNITDLLSIESIEDNDYLTFTSINGKTIFNSAKKVVNIYPLSDVVLDSLTNEDYINVNIRDKCLNQFIVEKSDLYRIFVNSDYYIGKVDGKIGKNKVIFIDGIKFIIENKYSNQKWIDLGSLYLDKGKHYIYGNISYTDDNDDKGILIVSEKKYLDDRNDIERCLKNDKKNIYLFKVDSGEKRDYLFKTYSDNEYDIKIKFKEEKIRLLKINDYQQIWLPASRDYKNKLLYQTRKLFSDEKAIFDILDNPFYGNIIWDEEKEKEEVRVSIHYVENVDLKKKQMMYLSYSSDRSIESVTAKLEVKIKTKRNRVFDRYFEFSIVEHNNVINVYEIAKKVLNLEQEDDCIIKKMFLIIKRVGLDSFDKLSNKYVSPFNIYALKFYDKYNFAVLNKGSFLNNYYKEYTCYYDFEGINTFDNYDKIPFFINNILEIKKKHYIDLKEETLKMLVYDNDKIKDFKIKLLLDFNGDNEFDAEERINMPIKKYENVKYLLDNDILKENIGLNLINKHNLYEINCDVYNLIKDKYPNKLHYYLIGVEIENYDKDNVFLIPVIFNQKMLNRNKIEQNMVNLINFKIDNKEYNKKLEMEKGIKNNSIIEIKSVFINAGEHVLKILDDNINYIELRPKLENRKERNLISTEFKKVNPTKYIVDVDAKKPFTLVFSESYHPKWKAFIDGKAIPDDKHFVVNGYANGFMIDKIGKYQIILEFTPQRLFYIGLIISGITLLGCIVYLIVDKVKEGKNSEVNR